MKSLGVTDLDVIAFANALSFQLPGWKLKPEPPRDDASEYERKDHRRRAKLWLATGKEEDRPCISLFWNEYAKEFTAHGVFPDQYDVTGHRISLNVSRPLTRIASDIQSRLIKPYLEAHRDAITKRNADRASADVAHRNARALAKALGVLLRENPHAPNRGYSRIVEWPIYAGDGRGRWKLSSYTPNHVEVEVTLPIAVALKLAAMIKKPAKKR
jgi:hypothetical protein